MQSDDDGWSLPARAKPDAGSGPDNLPGPGAASRVRLTGWVVGRVQGVGFRWWVRINALELGLVGWAENLTDGRVKVVAEGDRESCTALLERLEGPHAPGRVTQVTYRWDEARGGLATFTEV